MRMTRNTLQGKLEAKTRTPLTKSEERILLTLTKGSLPINELKEQMGEVQKLIGENLICIAVVQYIWGIEFNVELTQRGRAHVTERIDS